MSGLPHLKTFFIGKSMLQDLLSGKTVRATNVPEGARVADVRVNFEQNGIDVMMTHESFPAVDYGEHIQTAFLRLEKESS